MDDAHAAAQPQHLPSVDRLLRQPLAQSLIAEHGHTLVASQARNLLDAEYLYSRNISSTNGVNGSFNEPRTFGFEAKVRY